MKDVSDAFALIDNLYAVALEPERLDALTLAWNEYAEATLSRGRDEGMRSFDQREIRPHVERADDVLTTLASAFDVSYRTNTAIEAFATAALVADAQGRILAANAAMRGLIGGAAPDIGALPLDSEDTARLKALVRALILRGNAPRQLIRFRTVASDRLLIVDVGHAPGYPRAALVQTAELAWPRGFDAVLRHHFQLTAAEVAVLRSIILGSSVKDIAERHERSEGTVRTHIHALLQKTGTRSQIELVRMALGMMSVGGATAPDKNAFKAHVPIRLSDGRRITYLTLGDPKGRPCLWLPSCIGHVCLPASIEAALARRGIALFVLVRAGYGRSDRPPPGRRPLAGAAADLVELATRLDLPPCPVVAVSDDLRIAVEAATLAPERFPRIIACAGAFPVYRIEHFMRMPIGTRFIRGSARFSPWVVPFLLRVAFALVPRIGVRAFMKRLLDGSPADCAALDDPETASAIESGSLVGLGPDVSATETIAAEIVDFHTDWHPALAGCPVPILALHGEEDPECDIETVSEYASGLPGLTLVRIENAGRLAMFTHAGLLLDAIESAIGEISARSPTGKGDTSIR